MSDSEIRTRIRKAFDSMHKEAPPSFDAVWAAAEFRHWRERRRYAAVGGIAAVLAIIVVGLFSLQEAPVDDEFLIADALMNKTQWSAPSDMLLPQHQYDIYREVSFLVEPINFDEGSFL